MIIEILLCLVLVDVDAARNDRFLRYPYIVNRTCSVDRVFRVNDTPSWLYCATQCASIFGCKSFFYSSATRMCDGCLALYEGQEDVTEMMPGTHYYRKMDCEVGADWSYFNGSIYKILSQGKVFPRAEETCRRMCAIVVHLDSKEENDFIWQMQINHRASMVFIGLTDEANESDWRWKDDYTQPTFTKWLFFEPSGETIENCVVSKSLLKGWADVNCYWVYQSICERKMVL